jgi:benzoyl-CoA reductase/2-hydroxyglutaryl-CoA dehydratase subunit BcrC/BadD/HgdB
VRPEIMKEFERASELSLLGLAEHKEAGGKVAGVYCLFAPTELVRAAGAIPVSLCGKKEAPIPAAEKTLPPNLCPLIKSSYGYAVTDTCPFFGASDFILGETTCDGKKKMFELMGRIKPLHLMHLPYDTNGGHALAFWLQEITRLKDFLEEQTGQRIEAHELNRQIKLQNEIRRLLWRISRCSAAETIPLSGLDMMTVMETKSSCCDLEAYAVLLRRLIEELDVRSDGGVSVQRRGGPSSFAHRLSGWQGFGKGVAAHRGVWRRDRFSGKLHRHQRPGPTGGGEYCRSAGSACKTLSADPLLMHDAQ